MQGRAFVRAELAPPHAQLFEGVATSLPPLCTSTHTGRTTRSPGSCLYARVFPRRATLTGMVLSKTRCGLGSQVSWDSERYPLDDWLEEGQGGGRPGLRGGGASSQLWGLSCKRRKQHLPPRAVVKTNKRTSASHSPRHIKVLNKCGSSSPVFPCRDLGLPRDATGGQLLLLLPLRKPLPCTSP